jgi:undecaprenyl-diphosphatase
MPIWEAVLLGIIQGLTEFLPISSTAHLVVARTWLGHAHREDAFTVVIQLGTLVAVFVYFRAAVVQLAKGFLLDVRNLRIGSTPSGRTAWLIIVGTIPAVVVGFTLKKWLKENFYNVPSIGVVSIVFAGLLAIAEILAHWRIGRGRWPRQETDIGWWDALWIGCWQACALMPGGSRSGTTITGGLMAGLARPAAARFSFLLSLPVILGAGLKELYDEYKKLKSPRADQGVSLFDSRDDVAALIVGTLVSGVVGYFAIAFLLRFLQRYSTAVFIIYRVLFGIALLIAVYSGWLAR